MCTGEGCGFGPKVLSSTIRARTANKCYRKSSVSYTSKMMLCNSERLRFGSRFGGTFQAKSLICKNMHDGKNIAWDVNQDLIECACSRIPAVEFKLIAFQLYWLVITAKYLSNLKLFVSKIEWMSVTEKHTQSNIVFLTENLKSCDKMKTGISWFVYHQFPVVILSRKLPLDYDF